MPVVVQLERRLYGFVPVTTHDIEQCAQFALGARVRASLTKGKSLDMLAFYWALVQKVAEGTGYGKTPLSKELLCRTGYVDAFTFRNGDIHSEAMSIAEMDHSTLVEYVDRAIELICAEYIGGMTRTDLLVEVEHMVGISYDTAKLKTGARK